VSLIAVFQCEVVYANVVCSLAYHEMRLIMAKVLYAFDFELAPESENWKDQKTFILWQKKPLICKLKVVN
jgi:cytochrome P450